MKCRLFVIATLVVSVIAACGTPRRKSKSSDAESTDDTPSAAGDSTASPDGTDSDISVGDDVTSEPTDAESERDGTGEPTGDVTVPDAVAPTDDTAGGPDAADLPDLFELPDTWIDSDVPAPPDVDGPPDTFVPDTFVPDTFVPDTFVPDTWVGDDLAMPDTAEPPDTSAPDACTVYGTLSAGNTVSGNTTGAAMSVGVALGQCGGNGAAGAAAPEHVWQFTAPTSGTYTFSLYAAFDSALYVLGDCDSAATCHGFADLIGTSLTEELPIALAAGETVFVVVDGYQAVGAGDFGAYELRVDTTTCQPYCPPGSCNSDDCGGTCACTTGTCNPSTLMCEFGLTTCVPAAYLTCGDSYSFNTGDGLGTNLYSDYGTTSVCKLSGDDYSGPELAVRINVSAKTRVTVTEGSPAGTSLDLFVFEGASGSCVVDDASCRIAAYDTLWFDAVPGQDYFAIVDSYTGGAVSSTLSVSCCTPSCAGKFCGDDGCGGVCGSCGPGQECVASNCQSTAGLYGDVCSLPVELAPGANPIDARFFTHQYVKDCAIGGGVGADAIDAVVSITAAVTGYHRVTVDSTATADFYSVVNCSNLCSTVQSAVGAKYIDLELVAGETITLIIDGLVPAALANVLIVTLTPPTVEHAQLVINEFDYDQPGDDGTEYVEILNKGTTAATLANYALEFVNGADGGVYRTVALGDAGATLVAGGFLVVASQTIIDALPSNVARIAVSGPSAGWIQNGGPDGIRLVESGYLVDGVSYEGVLAGVGEGAATPSDDNGIPESLSRCPSGADIGNNSVDFSLTQYLTPGATNNCAVPPPSFNAAWGVFQSRCTPCHATNGSGSHNIGGSVVATAWSQSQLASYFAPGSTKGAAALLRIQNGSMPAGAGCTGIPSQDVGKVGCVTSAEQAIISAWIAAGQPGPK
jgi:hypothetical protein